MKAKRKMSRKAKIRRTMFIVVFFLALIAGLLVIKGTVKASQMAYNAIKYELSDQTEFDKMLTYGKHRVSYYSLNVRAEPSEDAEIIDELILGDYVYFSGNTFKHGFSLCEDHQKWVELKDGGWIAYGSFLDKDTFYRKFGHY